MYVSNVQPQPFQRVVTGAIGPEVLACRTLGLGPAAGWACPHKNPSAADGMPVSDGEGSAERCLCWPCRPAWHAAPVPAAWVCLCSTGYSRPVCDCFGDTAGKSINGIVTRDTGWLTRLYGLSWLSTVV